MSLISREAAERLTPTSEAANTAVDVLFHATGECALGKVLVARSIKGVCAILLGDDGSELESDLANRFPRATLVSNEAVVRNDLTKIARYVDDPSKGLDLALDIRGTPLQRRVWQTIRTIPVGQTRSYMQVARLINPVYPSVGARVVANACAANPIALAVPCHRVVRTNGELAGYRWGLMRKRELREKEAAA
jgi:methylated-DNA-[protein]-cysteine S-methyltransferase/AraC family transcriptional regulator of adaptative response/methylated-DNA-[protein]-cysteine methyltransferase